MIENIQGASLQLAARECRITAAHFNKLARVSQNNREKQFFMEEAVRCLNLSRAYEAIVALHSFLRALKTPIATNDGRSVDD